MVLRASPKADGPQQCNVCKRPVPIQAMVAVDASGSPDIMQNSSSLPQTCSRVSSGRAKRRLTIVGSLLCPKTFAASGLGPSRCQVAVHAAQ